MSRFCLFLAIVTSALSAAPLRTLVDRPGTWEAEWTSAGWNTATLPDGSVAFENPAGMSAEQIGDLRSSRLVMLLALPATGEWNWSTPMDSGSVVPVGEVARVPNRDPVTMVVARPGKPFEPEVARIETKQGFRLLRINLPLSRLEGPGKLRLTHRLRIRVEWTGAAKLAAGSSWPTLVDNPGGIRVLGLAAGRTGKASEPIPLGGRMAVVEVGDGDLFGSREDGLVRLSRKDLPPGMITTGISMSNIAVWSGPADTLPSVGDTAVSEPRLRLIPIQRRDLDGDGVLGADDEILFWARGPNLWIPDSSSAPGWSYSIHPFSRKRRYLIRLDAPIGSPELAAPWSGSPTRTFPVVRMPVNIGKPVNRLEKMAGESTSETDIGIGWYWISTAGRSSVELADSSKAGFPGIQGDSGWLKVRTANSGVLRGRASSLASAEIANGSAWVRSPSIDPEQAVWWGRGLASAGTSFRIVSPRGVEMPIQDCQVTYSRDLSNADSALFPAPAMGGVAIRAKDGLACWVLENGVAVRSCQVSGGYLRDSVRVPGTWFALFPAGTPGIRPIPASWSEASGSHAVRDFGAARAAEVLVVAPRLFLGVAEEYAVHREAAFQVRPMKVVTMALEDVYDLWSGGMVDPAAIRNAIQWANRSWGVTHVLLLGGGHADPRNVLGASQESQIPHWELVSQASDDYFAGLIQSKSSGWSVFLGRVPARNTDEARAWLAKLQVFEDPANAEFGPWRNRVVLAADDMQQGRDLDGIATHTEQMEKIGKSVTDIHPWMRLEKLYLVQYPLNSLAQKPEAARDLQTLLNQGMSALVYMGHGGAGILADENLLDVSTIDRTLKNNGSPFLFFAGSCSVGRNDLTNARGLSEGLVVARGKGCYAGIAATRPSFANANENLVTGLWSKLLSSSPRGTTLGEALNRAKEIAGGDQWSYNILGDPAVIPYPGGLEVRPDSVPDTISALARVRLSGHLPDKNWAQTRIEIAQALDSVQCSGKCLVPQQKFTPTSIQVLSTLAQAVDGAYASVPGFPALVPFGKRPVVKTYAWDPVTRREGGSVSGEKLFWGTVNNGFSDHEGPSIVVAACDSSWSGGIGFSKEARIPLPFCLSIAIQDTSGVSFAQGPDEGVVLSMPGSRDPWHPDLRQSADLQMATATMILDSTLVQPGGSYPLDILARDGMGNLSRQRVFLRPEAAGNLSLYEVFNSPNPVRGGESTSFFFKLSADPDTNGTVDSRANASIRIHTLSGRLVRVLRTELSNSTHPRPQATWDLRDSFGQPLANGLYPYTVILRVPNSTGTGTLQREAKGIVAISR